MQDYFDAIKHDIGGQRSLDPIVSDSIVKYDRQKRGQFHHGEDVANQFDVSLEHVRELLHHMFNHYDTVTCYSVHLLQPGHIIYYIDPFVVGFDQEVEDESVDVLGGSRFQAAVRTKGRFAIVTRIIGRTLKVVPVYTFNGTGLASKPPSVHREYVDLHDQNHWQFDRVSPHQPLEVGKAFCKMKPEAAVHLVTNSITLSSQILIAGTVRSESLERLREYIALTEG